MRISVSLLILLSIICAGCAKPAKQDDNNAEYADDDYASEPNGNTDNDDDLEEYDNGDEDENEEHVPPEIESEPVEVIVNAGETIQLPCNTKDADSYVVMWRKDDIPIVQSKIILNYRRPIIRMPNGTITIQEVTEEDAGAYTCSIILTEQSNINVTHHVTVRTSPKIISLEAAGGIEELKQGDDLELMCNASGYPKPQIKWYFDHKYKNTADDSKDSIFVGEKFLIENIGYERSGYYRCLADNGLKPAHQSILINVIHKPVVNIEKIYTDNQLREIVCIVHASPSAKVEWKKDSLPFYSTDGHAVLSHHEHEHKITFTNVKEPDFGRYTCTATNSFGTEETSADITDVPEKPHLLFSKSEKPREYTLTWTVHSHSPILESIVSYSEKNQPHAKEVFPKVSEKTKENVFTISHTFTEMKRGSYVAKLKSKNIYGWSRFSNETHFDVPGSRHSHRNKHHGSHTRDNAVIDRAESHTEEKQPENSQEEQIQTGSQLSSGGMAFVPTGILFIVTLVFLRH